MPGEGRKDGAPDAMTAGARTSIASRTLAAFGFFTAGFLAALTFFTAGCGRDRCAEESDAKVCERALQRRREVLRRVNTVQAQRATRSSGRRTSRQEAVAVARHGELASRPARRSREITPRTAAQCTRCRTFFATFGAFLAAGFCGDVEWGWGA